MIVLLPRTDLWVIGTNNSFNIWMDIIREGAKKSLMVSTVILLSNIQLTVVILAYTPLGILIYLYTHLTIKLFTSAPLNL